MNREVIRQLKRDGNTDPSRLFESWDYAMNIPHDNPKYSVEEMRELLFWSYM